MPLYILDFDGTLADTRGIILATTRHTLQSLGLPQPGDEAVTATIGLPLTACFERLLPPERRDLAPRCACLYKELFEQHNTPGAVPLYPHVADTIRALSARGAIVTIASSRGRESLQGFVRDMHLEAHIRLVVSADDVQQAKPHPEPVLKTLAALGTEAQEAIVVGDTPFDILMGRAAGTRTCGVTYGNGIREELLRAGADCLIDDFADLLRL